MAKKITRLLLATTCLIFSSNLFSQSNGDIYILEKSIDVLTQAGNFKRDETIAASRNGQMTVLRRVPSKDPKWWPSGVAIELVSINGKEQRPVRTVYVAKYWFRKGTRQGDVAQLPDPVRLKEEVTDALTPVISGCEVQIAEVESLTLPERPDNHDTYSELAQMVRSTRTSASCQQALRRWYKRNSMWKDLSRSERALLITQKANDIVQNIKLDGLVDACSRAIGRESDSDRNEIRNFMRTNLIASELKQLSYTNYEAHCKRFTSTQGEASIKDRSYFQKRTRDPHSIHPQLDSSLAICIVKREVTVTDFDPHSMNYSFCQASGRRGRPRSTAHGLGQFTQTTFLDLRAANLLPVSGADDVTSRSANRRIFREMSTDPEMQIESIFYYINYLLKANAPARIKHLHDRVYSDAYEDWEKAVIAYDQDRASDYIRGVTSCRRCIKNAGQNVEAQARCLSGD